MTLRHWPSVMCCLTLGLLLTQLATTALRISHQMAAFLPLFLTQNRRILG